LTNVVNAPVLR